MSKENNNTKYEKLNNYYSSKDSYNRPVLSSPLKFNNKKEYQVTKREKQQTNFFRNTWNKIKNVVKQKFDLYESQRIPLYIEYDMMSDHDIIGKALELYTEESCTLNETNHILNIYSNNKEVEKELHNLFYNILKINVNLPTWCHQMLKMGDCMVHWNLDDELGVIGYKSLPISDIERIDADYLEQKIYGSNGKDVDDTVFRWKTSHMVEFKHWQIGHFRLLLDDKRIPYGVSIIEKVRRLWNNLILAEDAMLSAQILRGIDRFIYYVDVGAIDHHDIKPFVDEVMSRFKKVKKIDQRTGQIDLKYNAMSIDEDYVIPKRGNNDASKIEKIEGQNNLDTAVVDYLMKKLIATLGIPSSFLNYEETSGDGKNLSMQDIRFSRTVSRIQQAILIELNKVAITHLYLCGLEDEVTNFTLSMNKASKQSELLDLDIWQTRLNLYYDATDMNNGIPAMSVEKAKKLFLHFSNDEIKNDLKEQYMDRAVHEALQKAGTKISQPSIFDDIISMYGTPNDNINDEDGDSNDIDNIGGLSGSGNISSLDDNNEDVNIDDNGNEIEGEQDTDVDITQTMQEAIELLQETTIFD